MNQPTTAQIIPFPVRRQSDVLNSAERLSAALASLSAALAEQRVATQRWRDALLALSERTRTMGQTVA